MITSKKCPTCNTHFESSDLVNMYFHKCRSRKDGYDWQCKDCKKSNDNREKRKERERKYYRMNSNGRADKCKARDAARRKFKADHNECSVLWCSEVAEELHHLNYHKPLDVVALCRYHHDIAHD